MSFEKMRLLTDLKYQQSQSALSEIIAREAKLRSEIKQLRERAFEAQSLPLAAHSMQNIGADVIWLRWVAQATQALNTELAQVLAKKETLLAIQRRALGRKTVAKNLTTKALQKKQRERSAREIKEATDIDLMRRLRDQ